MIRNKIISKVISGFLLSGFLVLNACSGEQADEQNNSSTNKTSQTESVKQEESVDEGKGFGPIKNITLSDTLDSALIAEGKAVFETKCTACHKIEARHVGPALQGVTERRKAEWIMNMIMNPSEMVQKDPQAKKLFAEYMVQMADQNVDEKGARAILEYLRSVEKK